MDNKNINKRLLAGMTLLEMVMALAIMAIIFASILPQFRNIQNSWDSKRGNSETLQNGRVLINYLNRYLTKAARITSVSDSSLANGFIEFEDYAGTTYRCDIGADNYVRFGPVGNLSNLAGPVTQLQFSCYSLDDMDTPTTDAATVRFIKVATTLPNPSASGQDKTLFASAYLRANGSGGSPAFAFGNNTEGPSEQKDVDGYMLATLVTVPQDMTLAAISAYIKVPPPKNLRYAIYTNDAGKPGLLIAQTEASARSTSSYHWEQVTVPAADLLSGTYWLALSFEHKSMYFKYDQPGQSHFASGDAVNDGFPVNWPATSVPTDMKISIYALDDGGPVLP